MVVSLLKGRENVAVGEVMEHLQPIVKLRFWSLMNRVAGVMKRKAPMQNELCLSDYSAVFSAPLVATPHPLPLGPDDRLSAAFRQHELPGNASDQLSYGQDCAS
eukprot:TRINITY_DN7254_c0_g3_i1.p3 TRINITY_DN7254_c0_g3~~TRINITY_DN7254_c0_g3_i1.p3  ORF type:complete len:104 (-),score=11.69 TRINITY_DN7254_c0_g3_i1:41-352(-)